MEPAPGSSRQAAPTACCAAPAHPRARRPGPALGATLFCLSSAAFLCVALVASADTTTTTTTDSQLLLLEKTNGQQTISTSNSLINCSNSNSKIQIREQQLRPRTRRSGDDDDETGASPSSKLSQQNDESNTANNKNNNNDDGDYENINNDSNHNEENEKNQVYEESKSIGMEAENNKQEIQAPDQEWNQTKGEFDMRLGLF